MINNYTMSYSTSHSTYSDKKHSKEKPCRVLLVCVYETIIFELNNQQIFEKFSPFGPITKILIFQKGEVTKFFIEFAQLDHACQAKESLDGLKFFENICKMNIYFSNFNNVDLKHESTEGADYQAEQQKKGSFHTGGYDCFSQNSYEQNLNFLDDEVLMQTFSPFGMTGSFTRSKTDNPKTLLSEIEKMQSFGSVNPIEEEEVDKTIKYQIQSLISEGQTLKESHSQKTLSNKRLEEQKQVSPLPVKQETANSIHHTVLSYEYKENVPARQIYNLFSNFGNIECIVIKKYKVYIKFRSGYFAAVAMNYLNGYSFYGSNLNLKYCSQEQQFLPKPYEYSQSLYFEASSDRFTPKRSITVNPPSDTLHVSSIKKQNCNQHSLRKIFSNFGYVERVKILMHSNEKNMALVKFSSVRQSFQAISQLHNKQFGGRKMQISFTKSKL